MTCFILDYYRDGGAFFFPVLESDHQVALFGCLSLFLPTRPSAHITLSASEARRPAA